MPIEIASWNDIIPVLRESHKLWSPGLSIYDYQEYVWNQLNASWPRRHLQYMVYRCKGQIATSCKIYRLSLLSRGKTYTAMAVGAVFTQKEFRGQGLATKLLLEIIDRGQQNAVDCFLLFSDIDPTFYENLGFISLGSAEFAIDLPASNEHKGLSEIKSATKTFPSTIEEYSNSKLINPQNNQNPDKDLLNKISRHYMRWLSRQPFGIGRSENYFKYKLGRECFINSHSKIGWPEITITVVAGNANEFAYAFTECSGMTMRILEIVGSPVSRRHLWEELYQKAKLLGLKRIRGWESIICDFAPNYSYRWLDSEITADNKIHSFERNWGIPMILPFTQAIYDWSKIFPCPLLELDL